MALNAVTIAAIVAACWAHPQGQAYLAKIYQIEALSIACGNPCCHGAYLPPAGKPPRFRPEPFVPAHIPYELIERRRDDEDAFLLGVLL